jgi:hypothetical protein
MIGLLKRVLPGFLLPLLFVLPCQAGPDDVVPRGSVAYDLLGSLAAAGRLTGYTLSDFARGDRLYTRREVARLLLANADHLTGDTPNAPFASLRRTLFMEFAPELKLLGVTVASNSALPSRDAETSGSAKLRLLSGPDQGTGTVRLAGTLPIGRDGILVLGGGNWRNEWYSGMPSLVTAARGLGAPFYENTKTAAGNWTGSAVGQGLDNAYVRINGRALDVTVGLQPLRWGPGYVGGMLLSDQINSVPQIEVEKGFRIPGTFGRHIGPLAFSQVFGEFFEQDDPNAPADATGTRRYFSARRLETGGTGRFQVSLSEAFKSTRLPGSIASQVLPYYEYQNDWTTQSRRRLLGFLAKDPESNTNWFNYFGDVSLSYRADKRGTILYMDYALDDIKAPFTLGNPNNTTTPRKVGQQYGVFLPDVGGIGKYALRLEYATSDKETYTNISAPIVWSQNNVPIGFPGGPNARLLFARADARISQRARLAAEAETRRRGVTLPDTLANEPDVNRVGLYGSYDLRKNAFLGARYENEKITPQVGDPLKISRVELDFGIGF